VRELRPGLWHWQARHPHWEDGEPWGPDVSSYAVDDGARLLLFDPLAVPGELLDRAAAREPVVVLTAPWHERDTKILVERLGAPVYAPPPDTAEDLMQKFGITRERAGDGSPDLSWLRAGAGEVYWFGAGDRLPLGVEAFPGREANDLVLWLDSRRAVVAGDTLPDFGDGLAVNRRLRGGVTRDGVVAGLRPLLARPVELVLPAHGAPTSGSALARALG
jgi:glyoxylase-like metal-dependent hydrolase (beta-lactamase superfamily II)